MSAWDLMHFADSGLTHSSPALPCALSSPPPPTHHRLGSLGRQQEGDCAQGAGSGRLITPHPNVVAPKKGISTTRLPRCCGYSTRITLLARTGNGSCQKATTFAWTQRVVMNSHSGDLAKGYHLFPNDLLLRIAPKIVPTLSGCGTCRRDHSRRWWLSPNFPL